MSDDLWDERATAVRIPSIAGRAAAEPSILFEGPLRDVVLRLAGWPRKDLDDVFVSLPDRRSLPNTYEGHMLFDLIGLVPRGGVEHR